MANRNRDRGYGRGNYGGEGRYGSDYDRENYGSYRGGGSRGGYDYDREENYFGGDQSRYGGGYSGGGYNRGDYGSSESDYGDYGQSNRGYSGGMGRGGGRGGYNRENYGGGYGGYSSQNQYGGGYSSGGGGGDYGGDYGRYGGTERGGYSRGGYSGQGSYGGGDYGQGGGSLNEYGGGGTYGGYRDRRSYNRGGEQGGEQGGGYDADNRGFLEQVGDEVASWFGYDEDENRQGGRHRGRGPRNYTRSDDRIREDINDRLTDDDFLDASDIDVEVNDREVVLTGTVDSRYAKRRAEDIAESVSGVTHCENRIRVNREGAMSEQNSSYNTGTSRMSGEGGTTGMTTGSSTSTGTTGTTSGLSTSTGTSGTTAGSNTSTETTGTTETTGKTGKARGKSV